MVSWDKLIKKLVVNIGVPKGAKIRATRINTTVYDKQLFLQMKEAFKSKF